jgi:hypothetical protein
MAKAKKARKVLADANQGRIQREEAITNRLNRISALAGGEYFCILHIVCLLILLVVTYTFCVLLAEKIGVSLAPLQPVDEDSLMATVNLLELHWISVQEVLVLTRHVLTRIFVGLWPKKKADMPTDDLKKLAAVFDTAEDPILSMKSRSVKRGTEGVLHFLIRMVRRLIGRRLAHLVIDLFRSCWFSLRRQRSMRQALCQSSHLWRLLRLPHQLL